MKRAKPAGFRSNAPRPGRKRARRGRMSWVVRVVMHLGQLAGLKRVLGYFLAAIEDGPGQQHDPYAWLGGWLARVRHEQPDLAFDLKVGTTDELDAMIVGGALDLAIGTRGFGYRAVQRRALTTQPMVFVGASARHDKPEYTLRELAAEGFITFQMRSIAQQALHDLLRADDGLDHCRVDTVSSVAVPKPRNFTNLLYPGACAVAWFRAGDGKLVAAISGLRAGSWVFS